VFGVSLTEVGLLPPRRGKGKSIRGRVPEAKARGPECRRITDDNGRSLGAVQIEMPNEGEIELGTDAIEITGREESLQ
jgi:hypothetical protein